MRVLIRVSSPLSHFINPTSNKLPAWAVTCAKSKSRTLAACTTSASPSTSQPFLAMDTPAPTPAVIAQPPVWYASLPAPKNKSPGSITRPELLLLLQADSPAKKFLLIDVRRTDYEGGTIHGSINLPAQSLYHTIPRLYELFKAAGVETVIWYCGSSRGRGTRAAGWFDDYIKAQDDSEMESIILLEGITGWAKAGEEYVKLMDDYSAEAWSASH